MELHKRWEGDRGLVALRSAIGGLLLVHQAPGRGLGAGQHCQPEGPGIRGQHPEAGAEGQDCLADGYADGGGVVMGALSMGHCLGVGASYPAVKAVGLDLCFSGFARYPGKTDVFCCEPGVRALGDLRRRAGRCGLKSALLGCAAWRLGLGDEGRTQMIG